MTVFGSVFRAWPIPAVPQILAWGVGVGREGEYEKETGTEMRTDSEAEGQTQEPGGDPGDGAGEAGLARVFKPPQS